MSETHTPHHDAPKISSWARSSVVRNTQIGYIVASLAWVRIESQYRTRFSKLRSNPTSNPNRIDAQKIVLTLTLTLTYLNNPKP